MSSTPAGPLSGLSVLIVEDEFLIAAEAQHYVETAGAAITLLANSLDAAIEHVCSTTPPDIVILDLVLGRQNGGPLTDSLNEKGIPYVVASGLAPPPGREHETAGFVAKPYSENDLITAIVLALARRRTGYEQTKGTAGPEVR